jgi:nucleoside-diphosphate-sugar epimerase
MNIFLTGATGYIGHEVATHLVKNGDTVRALVRDITKAKTLLHPSIRLFQGDITNAKSVRQAMRGCDQVYHLASYARLWSADKRVFYDVNVSGTRNVLDAALENGVTKLVYTSSCGVFGNSLKHPLSEKDSRVSSFTNDYDLTKHICECMVREYVSKGFAGVIVNPSRVYGPGQTAFSNPFSKMIERCLQGKIVVVPRPGNVLANYAFIDDVVKGHIAAMRLGIPGERYILGGANLSYDEVVNVIRSEIFNPRIVPVGSFVLKSIGLWNLLKCRITGIEPDLTPNVVSRITNNAALDCSKAISELNYEITPFRRGIRATIVYNLNPNYGQYLFHFDHRSERRIG